MIADWDGVCSVTIEVHPERAGREPLVVTAGHTRGRPGAASACLTLVDRGLEIGRLVVVLDDPEGIDARFPEQCEALTPLIAAAAARCRLEAMLLDAQSYEVVGQIAAGLVHDFNNMLTGIAGNLAVARELLNPGDPALVPIQRGSDAAGAAATVARALLNFVRGSLGRSELSVNEVAVATQRVITGAVPDGVAVTLDLGPDVPLIMGEQALLQQALVNLVLNGAQSIDGDGCVAIATRRVGHVPERVEGQPREAEAYVALSVRDTGCGIAPEHAREVFRPFFSTKGSRGTGLGLTSVLQVARRHGGAVGVESTPGSGTTFTIYLPAQPEPAWATAGAIREGGVEGIRT
jgi:two-component system cell cycle sensor histidine kinase/response regulator CckA